MNDQDLYMRAERLATAARSSMSLEERRTSFPGTQIEGFLEELKTEVESGLALEVAHQKILGRIIGEGAK